MSIRQFLLSCVHKCLLALMLSQSLVNVANAQVSVVSTIRPLQFIAAAIVGDTGDTFSIENSSHAHHITLSPSDRLQINRADLLLWIGPDFEIYLSDLFANAELEKSTVTITDIANMNLLTMSNQQIDPHLWLDPDNALQIARTIKERLAGKYPQQAQVFQARYDAFDQQLLALWTEIEARFTAAEDAPYIVYHDAYRYFEQALGINHGLALLDNPEVQPGMREVLRIRESVAELGASCVILEPDSSADLVATLLGDAPAKSITIDLLGFDITVSEQAYLDLLDEVATGFQSCLTAN